MMRTNKPILLVEDDEVDVLTVRRALRELWVANPLAVASNGEEALELLRDPGAERPALSEPIDAELIEVQGLTPADSDPDRRQPFSLVFRGPMDAPLEQGIFHLENETLGGLDLFLVCNGPDKEGMRHEAVFT